MPRRADMPCAGGCGRLLWRGSTSLPEGEATCRPCRAARKAEVVDARRAVAAAWRAARSRHRTCEVCEAPYYATCTEQRTCGRTCGEALRRLNGALPPESKPKAWPSSKVYFVRCAECSTPFVARVARTVCCPADRCRRARASRQATASIMRRYYADPAFRASEIARVGARRASALGLGDQPITIDYLMVRDRRRCGICGRKVRATRGRLGPSLDHIVPLSKGGQHDLANVQLAHLTCNISKGNRGGGEQLALVG